MKKTTSVYLAIGLFIAGLTTLSTFSPLRAQSGNPNRKAEVVILNANPVSRPPIPGSGNFAGYDGMGIYCSSVSANAPKFPNYPEPSGNLAQAIADLLDDSYELRHITADGSRYILIKR